MFLRQQKWHGRRGMGYPKDEDSGGLPLLIEMPVPMGIRVPAPVKINVGGNETARWRGLMAHCAATLPVRHHARRRYRERRGAGLGRQGTLSRQICWTDRRLRKLVNNTLLECGKTGCLQAVFVQIRHNAVNVISQQDMPTKLLGKSVLNIDNIIPPIELAGNKKGWRREHNLPLNHAFGVAQTDILLPLMLNRKCINVTECWKCHGGQAYPKCLGASTRRYCPPSLSLAISVVPCYEQYRAEHQRQDTYFMRHGGRASTIVSIALLLVFLQPAYANGEHVHVGGLFLVLLGGVVFLQALLSCSISSCVPHLRRRTRTTKARSRAWLVRSLYRPRRGPGPEAHRRSVGPWQTKPGDARRWWH